MEALEPEQSTSGCQSIGEDYATTWALSGAWAKALVEPIVVNEVVRVGCFEDSTAMTQRGGEPANCESTQREMAADVADFNFLHARIEP